MATRSIPSPTTVRGPCVFPRTLRPSRFSQFSQFSQFGAAPKLVACRIGRPGGSPDPHRRQFFQTIWRQQHRSCASTPSPGIGICAPSIVVDVEKSGRRYRELVWGVVGVPSRRSGRPSPARGRFVTPPMTSTWFLSLVVVSIAMPSEPAAVTRGAGNRGGG